LKLTFLGDKGYLLTFNDGLKSNILKHLQKLGL